MRNYDNNHNLIYTFTFDENNNIIDVNTYIHSFYSITKKYKPNKYDSCYR